MSFPKPQERKDGNEKDPLHLIPDLICFYIYVLASVQQLDKQDPQPSALVWVEAIHLLYTVP